MTKSVTRSVIALVSKALHANFLKAQGFKRSGAHIYKPVGDLFHGIHFHASRWGTTEEGMFTLDFFIAIRVAFEYWTLQPFPKNPAAATFPIAVRIGSLLPDRKDKWWPVNISTDIDVLAQEITQLITGYSTPFFLGYPNSSALLQRLRAGEKVLGLQGNHFRLIHAILAKGAGLQSEAADQIQKALIEAGRIEFKVQFVTEMGKRIGVL